MDSRFGVEWTAAEVEEARSIVARLSNGYYDAGAGNNDDTRHDRIVRELQAWFPWRTMRQVIDLYVDLVVETVQAAAQPQEDGGAGAVVHPTFDLVNNFGMPTEAAMNNVDVGMNYGGLSMVFGGAMEETVEQAPQPPVVNGGNDDEEVNQGPGRQHAAPNTGRFWTTDEHRLFLRGLRVYGRGDWKNISKYFVTTRTPVQVSSHAQKYFRRLESAASKQRYSINDVGLYDADPWGAAMDDDNKNFGGWQALAFAGGHLEAVGGVGHIPPATSSVAAMNNVAQFWAPLLEKGERTHRVEPNAEKEKKQGQLFMDC
ncbi:hypothetical protein E2562_003600 [Oryza meyeriana var. granulata]|uniref:Uncharacterized protein n=1 Tax=Oryza meyeriana var. granulata TaxID=110450 RepID=A0A6G1CMF8_9ORYZ|nr:hypothetical protein E2562_003600 [Oryza meyeriana var. granulata]